MVVFDFFTFFTICFVGQISAAACAIITALGVVANLLTVTISILTFVYVDTGFHILFNMRFETTMLLLNQLAFWYESQRTQSNKGSDHGHESQLFN